MRDSERAPLVQYPDDMGGVRITHIAGTIDVDEKDRLKKLLFRATRGKALTFFSDFKTESKVVAGQKTLRDKSVYIVVFQEGVPVVLRNSEHQRLLGGNDCRGPRHLHHDRHLPKVVPRP